MALECNVGDVEREARLGVGVAAMGAGILLLREPVARAVALGVGAIGLVTGLTRHCPVNSLMGRSTCGAAPH